MRTLSSLIPGETTCCLPKLQVHTSWEVSSEGILHVEWGGLCGKPGASSGSWLRSVVLKAEDEA